MKLSIIIPTYNEEEHIGKVITHVQKHISTSTEIIIVDGGSTDNTTKILKQHNIRTITSKYKGRAHQLITGANKATGDILYFLHADTYPPRQFEDILKNTVNKGVQAGVFNLQFDTKHWFLTQCVKTVNVLGWHFGDKSFFITKKLYKEIGGFKPLQIMEDYDIIRRTRNKAKFRLLRKHFVTTSARKYQKIGVFKLHFIYLILFIMYLLRIKQKYLVRTYKKLV